MLCLSKGQWGGYSNSVHVSYYSCLLQATSRTFESQSRECKSVGCEDETERGDAAWLRRRLDSEGVR